MQQYQRISRIFAHKFRALVAERFNRALSPPVLRLRIAPVILDLNCECVQLVEIKVVVIGRVNHILSAGEYSQQQVPAINKLRT
jgi:hypothetical protein